MDVGGIDELGRLRLSDVKIDDLCAIERLVGDVYRKEQMKVEATYVSQIAIYLSSIGMTSSDVSEIYSPPRFAAEAPRFGLRAGFSADLETLNPNGVPWGSTRKRT